MIDTDKIIEILRENDLRLGSLQTVYNPISGEGSEVCERVACSISDSGYTYLYLPKKMVEESSFTRVLLECGSFQLMQERLDVEYSIKNGMGSARISLDDVIMTYIQERIRYDFEFWAGSFIYIKGKISEKSINRKSRGGYVKFVLNRGQRKLLKEIYSQWESGDPIRIILLKARQWGGSTLTQIFMMWIQLVHHKQWNSVICAHVENAARIVRGMFDNALKMYPYVLDMEADKLFELRPYQGSTKTRVLDYRNCRITIGSAEKPDGLRSEDLCMAHFSEVGLFKSTEGKKPEDLIQSIMGSIPLAKDTMVVYESTAKGVGNMFHREWTRAKQGKSVFKPVFVAWYDVEMYFKEIPNKVEFANTLTPSEMILFDNGATLEHIAWYREKQKELEDNWRFVSEYPSTDLEAFQSTGRRYFNLEHVERLRRDCMPPAMRCDVLGDELYGKGALSNVRLSNNDSGMFSVWEIPDDIKMVNGRYVVVVDVNRGRTNAADNGIICVFDRYWMSEGGVPEIVAEWCGHIEMRYFIWKSVQIAKLYQDALLVIESNTPESTGEGGFEMESVFDEISGYYSNLFYRTSEQDIKQGRAKKWGFHMNKSTKLMICSHQEIALDKQLYIERSIEAADEHDTFEYKEDGRLGAVEGNHDDRLITRALGVWVCYQHMKMPIIAVEGQFDYSTSTRVVNESSL